MECESQSSNDSQARTSARRRHVLREKLDDRANNRRQETLLWFFANQPVAPPVGSGDRDWDTAIED
jgi:hypothetical protein